MWKKRFQWAAWCTLALLSIVLLVAAVQKKNSLLCKDVHIEIEGAQEHVFVDEKHLEQVLAKAGAYKGVPISNIQLRRMEEKVEKDAWIRKAELFFDNNRVLQVKIEEREPLARIFTLQGNSFYIDSGGTRLPLSDRMTARVPVFTSFPGDKVRLSGPDSAVLVDIKLIARAIAKDSFWTDLVSQVDITPQRTYQIVPQLGNQVIELGNTDNLEGKLDRLYSFYRQVWAKAGFEKYEKIDVQYEGQIVATRRGEGPPVMDSVKAMEQLNNSIAQANSLGGGTVLPAVSMPAVAGSRAPGRDSTAAGQQPPRPAAQRPKPVKPVRTGPKPRAVMPRRH